MPWAWTDPIDDTTDWSELAFQQMFCAALRERLTARFPGSPYTTVKGADFAAPGEGCDLQYAVYPPSLSTSFPTGTLTRMPVGLLQYWTANVGGGFLDRASCVAGLAGGWGWDTGISRFPIDPDGLVIWRVIRDGTRRGWTRKFPREFPSLTDSVMGTFESAVPGDRARLGGWAVGSAYGPAPLGAYYRYGKVYIRNAANTAWELAPDQDVGPDIVTLPNDDPRYYDPIRSPQWPGDFMGSWIWIELRALLNAMTASTFTTSQSSGTTTMQYPLPAGVSAEVAFYRRFGYADANGSNPYNVDVVFDVQNLTGDGTTRPSTSVAVPSAPPPEPGYHWNSSAWGTYARCDFWVNGGFQYVSGASPGPLPT